VKFPIGGDEVIQSPWAQADLVQIQNRQW